MATTTVTVGPATQRTLTFGAQSDTTEWSTYRNIAGNVQMRLTDVTGATGLQWDKVYFEVWLLNTAGIVFAHGVLPKTWGVLPGYTGLGSVGGLKQLRLRTRLNISRNSGIYQEGEGTWTAQLRWDPDNIPV